MSKKLLGLIAGLAVALSVMVVPVVHGEDAINLDDMSNEQLIAYIQALLQGGSTVTTPTNDTTPTTGSSNWVSLGIPAGFQFSKNLSQGMTGNDVKYLQIVLNSDPATTVATTGAGSKGNESSYFGGLSKAAVVKFQEKYASSVLTPLGLTKGTGFVGTTTRAQLNELLAKGTTGSVDVSGLTAVECVTQGYAWNGTVCSDPKAGQIDVSSLSALDCVTKGYAWNGTKCYDPKGGDSTAPVVAPVTGAGLVVALSSDSPANSTLITGQSAAPLAKFVITNKDSVEAKVTKVELQRTGVSGDTTLANVYLFDGMTRLTDAATISQGKITFNSPNGVFTIPAGNSIILTIASDIEAGTAGQTAGVALIGLTSNLEVKSTLPITGGTQTIASADLAEVTVGTATPSTNVSVNAGATGYTVFQAPITVTKREVELKGATFKVIGSIPTDALENIKLYYNGALISDAITLSSDYTARFVLSTPKKIQSGNLEVRADIVKGSSRNFSFSLQNASDLTAVDSAYNVNAIVKGTPKTTATVTVNSGSVSITQDPTFNQTSVTGGVSNVTLAKFNFKAYGEDVKISTLDVKATLTTVQDASAAAITTIDNVTIYANGNPITTNKNLANDTAVTFNLGSSLVIPANTVVSVEIKGDTKGSKTVGGVTTNNVSMASGTIVMGLVAGTNNAQGVSSMQLTNTSVMPGHPLKVGSGTLTLVKNPSVADGKITQNTSNQRIGSFVVQAGDSEGVRISNVSVALAFTNSMTTNQLSNLYIKYAGEESDKITPQATNNFSINKEIAANESMIVDVYVDVSTASTSQTVQSTLGVSTYGLSSNISITPAAVGGQTMTVAVPEIAADPKLTSDSLAAQFVLGSQKYEVAKFNFVAKDGEVTLDKVSFSTTGNTITSITVAGKTVYVTNNVATITGLNFTIPAGYAGKDLPVTVTYNKVDKANPVVSGTTSELKITGYEYLAGNERKTQSSKNIPANTMTVVNAIPSVALTQDNRTGLTNGLVKLADITVSTDKDGGAILLQELPINVVLTDADAIGLIVSANANEFIVRDAAGKTIATTSGALTAGAATITFTDGYRIEAGQSATFSVHGTVSGVAKDDSITTRLGAKANFKFKDVNSDTSGIAGTPIYTYSNNYSTIKY